MKYLVICEHKKSIIDRASSCDARNVFRCKRCVVFDLVAETWMYKDVRVYLASQKDVEIVVDTQESHPVKRLKSAVDQTDWVGK